MIKASPASSESADSGKQVAEPPIEGKQALGFGIGRGGRAETLMHPGVHEP